MNIDLEKDLQFHSKDENNIQEIIDILKTIKSQNSCNKLVVDRIEGDFAVCEDLQTGKIMNLAKNILPKDTREETVLIKKGNKYIIDANLKNDREKHINEITKNLWSN